jgi:CheY-like chemotaxis protein/AraC-like DNA-binding protein
MRKKFTVSNSYSPNERAGPAILWTDDQPDEAGLLRLLSIDGFSVTVATTGTTALSLASDYRYDAIVVDLHLPDLHGFTVIERLRAKGISCPVIAVTGHYLDPEAPQHAREAGATAFHYKPLSPEEIANSLRVPVGPQTLGGASVSALNDGCPRRPPAHSPVGARPAETIATRVLARLDSVVLTTFAVSDARRQDILLAALLAALADPELPLAAVAGCAQAVRMTITSPAVSPALASTACDMVRRAMRQTFTARHPVARRALAILEKTARWREEEDLAKEVEVSRSHFARVLRQETGLEYRTLRRLVMMKIGMVRLLNTDDQVAQIAYGLGMQPGTFDSVFGDTFGCCPRDLRRLWSRLGS